MAGDTTHPSLSSLLQGRHPAQSRDLRRVLDRELSLGGGAGLRGDRGRTIPGACPKSRARLVRQQYWVPRSPLGRCGTAGRTMPTASELRPSNRRLPAAQGAIRGTKRHFNQLSVCQFTADYVRNPDCPPQDPAHTSKQHQPPSSGAAQSGRGALELHCRAAASHTGVASSLITPSKAGWTHPTTTLGNTFGPKYSSNYSAPSQPGIFIKLL